MRIAADEAELRRVFPTAVREAEAAFGDGRVYVERYLEGPRHVEFQILGDARGRVVHLGERDCSIQRRHQKLVEESPSPAVDEDLRARMGEAAVRGAASIGYRNAGTVEFLLERDGSFWFLEINARIQVEHPVTEMVTGVDLVREQIRIAAGEPLTLPEQPLPLRGHAIEFRINAEDPARGFLPSPGRISSFHVPGGPGVRVDTHAYAGYAVPPQYDSLVAKLICHGQDRAEALGRARAALEELVIEGIRTTAPFHQSLLRDPRFEAGDVDTHFLETFPAAAEPPGEPAAIVVEGVDEVAAQPAAG
jgi:acetyl-CoA carboxylase biotin carboxylase subunit